MTLKEGDVFSFVGSLKLTCDDCGHCDTSLEYLGPTVGELIHQEVLKHEGYDDYSYVVMQVMCKIVKLGPTYGELREAERASRRILWVEQHTLRNQEIAALRARGEMKYESH